MPYYSVLSLWTYIILFLPYLLFLIFLDITGKVKNNKLKAYGGYYGLLLFSISFGIPAVKLFYDNHFIQFFIILIWLIIFWMVKKNKDIAFQIVFPEGSQYRTYSIIYYGFIVLVIFAGGGGYYKSGEYFSRVFGENAAMSYFSIILLLISYWFIFFAQSATSSFKRFKK